MQACCYHVTIVTSNNELNFLCGIPHFETHLLFPPCKSVTGEMAAKVGFNLTVGT